MSWTTKTGPKHGIDAEKAAVMFATEALISRIAAGIARGSLRLPARP